MGDGLKRLIQAAQQLEEADLIIQNGTVVEVFSLETFEADVAIRDGRIVGIGTYPNGKQVVDATGEPVIGATVQVKGTTNGTITDFDGNFTLNNVPEKGILVISYIGYKAQEVNISGKTSIKVVVKEDTEVLDEVVVVGYGVQKKVNLTGSISSINEKDIENILKNF